MIKLTDTLPPKHPTLAAELRIYSLFTAYAGSGLADFWCQWDDDKLTAVAAKMDSDLTLCLYDGADVEEICEFLSVVGAGSVLSNKPLPMAKGKELYQFCYTPKSGAETCFADADYKTAYSIMSTRFDMPPYDVWYPDLCHRVRHGAACLISENGASLCGFMADDSMLIVGFSSLPENKGKGALLLNKVKNSNLAKFYTLLSEESLKQYYVNQEFTLTGKHYTYGDV